MDRIGRPGYRVVTATILRIHSIISPALDLAVRYDWADRNVAKNASPPHPRKREPDPPSPD